MNRGIIKFENYELEYYVYGSGPKNFIAFHGHGRNAGDFKPFTEDLNATIYSFNLFFHGHSKHPPVEEIEPISHKKLAAFYKIIIEKFQWEEYNFLSFSLGGKFVLNFLNYYPKLVNQVILMAPDGINKSVYSRSAHYAICRKWFRSIVVSPNRFLKLVRFLYKARVISENINKFIHYQLATPSRRMRAFLSWKYLRNIYPNHKELTRNLRKYNNDLVFIMGEKDRIIPIKSAKRFIENKKRGRLFSLNINHHFFRKETIPEIKKMLSILAEHEQRDERKDKNS